MLWFDLRLLDEQSGYPPLKLPRLFEDCLHLVNSLLYVKKQRPVYEIRIVCEAGFELKNEDVERELSKNCFMYGKDVERMRIEILRWGDSKEYGKNGVDRYTVGEYTMSGETDECLIFKLPSIMKCSYQDPEMFLDKGWASVLMHMRILVGCMVGMDFEIQCVHKQTTMILRKYDGLCTCDTKLDDDTQTDDDTSMKDNKTFSFEKTGPATFATVARKALYLLLKKIGEPKCAATYQVRMHDLFV